MRHISKPSPVKSKMVVIHIKNGQADGFLFEASVQDTNDSLIAGLVRSAIIIIF